MLIDPYKAPRPDGFQSAFFKSHQKTIDDDLLAVARDAFEFRVIDKRLVEIVIVLIPKVEPPTKLKDLRPMISLRNFIVKFVTYLFFIKYSV